MKSPQYNGYEYANATLNPSHGYLLPELDNIFNELGIYNRSQRVFDLGCGNGSISAYLASKGLSVTGVDPSTDGIREAQKSYPHLKLEEGSAYDDLAGKYGRFPVIVSLEIVEHVYSPREYARTLFDLLEPGGVAIVSTPYHGYLKNLALAFSGKMDAHFTALWDHGHIKFWSINTLSQLLTEAGFSELSFRRVGRLPPLAKSMIAIARKPAGDAT